MAVDRAGRVPRSRFTGHSGVGTGPLAQAVRTLLIKQAALHLDVVGTAGLTDTSGGTPGASVKAEAIPALADVTSSGGFTPASFNTARNNLRTAWATLIERCNLVRAALGMGSADDGPGTPGGGTIAAITVTLSAGTGASAASWKSARAAILGLQDFQRTVIANINECRAAVGLAACTEEASVGGFSDDALTIPTVPDVATSATGADGMTLAAAQVVLNEMKDNVAFFADRLDEVTGINSANVLLSAYAGI